jgi:hypothetical protein
MIARMPAVDVFYIDGGRSRIFSSGTSQGPRCRRFLAFMVGAPGSLAPAPLRGLAVNVFTLMVDASGSLSAPSRGPVFDFS